MYINFSNKRYNLLEFNFYGLNDENPTYVLELLVDGKIDELDNDLPTSVVLGINSLVVLDEYTLIEKYGIGDHTKIVYTR